MEATLKRRIFGCNDRREIRRARAAWVDAAIAPVQRVNDAATLEIVDGTGEPTPENMGFRSAVRHRRLVGSIDIAMNGVEA